MKKKIGLIGFGVIGKYIFEKIENDGLMEVDFVYDKDPQKTESLHPSMILNSVNDLIERPVHLVVEVAHPQAVRDLGMKILRNADFLIFSLTSLADDEFRQKLENFASASKKKIYIPHGAILGLDGIYDGRNVIETVEITTIKHPKNLNLREKTIDKPTVVYQGSVRGACECFPRNVNVHAAIALSGIGFDKTISKIIADPGTDRMTHNIKVNGMGLCWGIHIESRSVGAVTGTYTPESVYQTVRRLCSTNLGFQLA
jgi:aspartate dehydrogenase